MNKRKRNDELELKRNDELEFKKKIRILEIQVELLKKEIYNLNNENQSLKEKMQVSNELLFELITDEYNKI